MQRVLLMRHAGLDILSNKYVKSKQKFYHENLINNKLSKLEQLEAQMSLYRSPDIIKSS